MDRIGFLSELDKRFQFIVQLLQKILKQETLLEDNFLVKKGFLFHSYSLKPSAMSSSLLQQINDESKTILSMETQLFAQMQMHWVSLLELNDTYKSRNDTSLFLERLPRFMEESLGALKDIAILLDDIGRISLEKTHHLALGNTIKKKLEYFETLASKIRKNASYVEQVLAKAQEFEKLAYYPSPRMYGRAMAVKEFKETVNVGRLSSGKDPTPVFDCSLAQLRQIKKMNEDEKKNFFNQIGVQGGCRIVIFQTRVKPINANTPIPQSNGLREYKFPKHLQVEILEIA